MFSWISTFKRWLVSEAAVIPPLTWQQVLDEERMALAAKTDPAGRKPSAGLALSGGGIRSATFCLGVIQGLATSRKLSRFDYLSTVSGGGYIGSWLSALICRRAHGDVAAAETLITPLVTPQTAKKLFAAPALDVSVEHPSLQWLRSYSNYLTPRLGIFGVDTWTAIVTYLRNLTLNWLVLLPLLLALILAALCVFPVGQRLHGLGPEAALFAALGGLTCVAGVIGWCIDQPRLNVAQSKHRSTGFVFFSAGLGTLLTAWFASIGLGATTPTDLHPLWMWGVGAGFINMVVWAVAAAIRQLMRGDAEPSPTAAPDFDAGRPILEHPEQWLLPMFLSGAFAGVMFRLWAEARHGWMEAYEKNPLAPAAFDTVIGMPAMLLIMSHAILLFIGLSKRRMSEADREWLGRLGAILSLLGMAWLALYAMLWLGAVVSPLQESLAKWLAGIGFSAWLLQTLWAVLLGKSSLSSGGKDGKRWLEVTLSVAPYLFAAGLVAAASFAVFTAMHSHTAKTDIAKPAAASLTGSPAATEVSLHASSRGTELSVKPEPRGSSLAESLRTNTLDALEYVSAVGERFLAFGVLMFALLAGIMSWRVDINLFSYNRFYGNRLARAYLGASRHRAEVEAERRRAHPFTDLDPDDDLSLAMLATHGVDGKPQSVQRPLHLINTALNLTGAPDLAWQSRKAASFTLSPLHCGYAFPTARSTPGMQVVPEIEGYRRSYEYGVSSGGRESVSSMGQINRGVTYAMAFPTSGAAASPNMGYHSTPAMALLLTTFNVRLGRWFGNTRDNQAWRRRTPTFSLRALLNELLGKAGFTQPWLHLSDGGHFENLGIYELVRRKLKVIVAIDAAADPEYRFADLANAIRLVSTDFGVQIVMPDAMQAIHAEGKSGMSRSAFVYGEIYYPDDPWPGKLIYVKPALLADTPVDVMEYARRGTGFPQETTGDQWFSEAQFESYRRLGESIADKLCKDAQFTRLV